MGAWSQNTMGTRMIKKHKHCFDLLLLLLCYSLITPALAVRESDGVWYIKLQNNTWPVMVIALHLTITACAPHHEKMGCKV